MNTHITDTMVEREYARLTGHDTITDKARMFAEGLRLASPECTYELSIDDFSTSVMIPNIDDDVLSPCFRADRADYVYARKEADGALVEVTYKEFLGF